MRIAIYCRVSTADKNQDINLQMIPLREYAERQGWSIAKEYVDVGYSGGTDKRPGLQAMLKDCRRRLVDGVVIWKLDRLFRSLEHFVQLTSELQSLGIRLISLTEAIDLGSAQGRLLANLLAVFSEFEKDLIRERVLEGLVNARRKGKKLGRPSKDVDVETMLNLRTKGFGIKRIARQMKLSVGKIHKTLSELASKNSINSTQP
jgi:putative DNA-invertase from lambdoid prophage Rac